MTSLYSHDIIFKHDYKKKYLVTADWSQSNGECVHYLSMARMDAVWSIEFYKCTGITLLRQYVNNILPTSHPTAHVYFIVPRRDARRVLWNSLMFVQNINSKHGLCAKSYMPKCWNSEMGLKRQIQLQEIKRNHNKNVEAECLCHVQKYYCFKLSCKINELVSKINTMCYCIAVKLKSMIYNKKYSVST